MTEQNDTNQKTTVAVLGVKMDNLTSVVEDAVIEVKAQAKRTVDVEKCIAVLTVEYKNLDEKVDKVDKKVEDTKDKNKLANIGIAAGEVLVFIMAALGIRQ